MIDTPIAELGFIGVATGAALMGMRPITDVQYGDFLFLASDQIINNAAKMRYMSGGGMQSAPGNSGPHWRDGTRFATRPKHGTLFYRRAGFESCRRVQCLRRKGNVEGGPFGDDNPVLIFEHKLLYGSKGARAEAGAVDATSEIPDGDYTVPLDKAVVRQEGSQVTILGWLLMAHFAAQAAAELAGQGISAEVIDVRSLSPIDYGTIGESVKKTGRVVIVEEGPKTGGVSAEISAGIMEHFGEYLLAPVVRLASPDVPVPFTPVLENAYRPDAARIVAAVRELLR